MTLTRWAAPLFSVINPAGGIKHYNQGQNNLPVSSIYQIKTFNDIPILCSWGDGFAVKPANTWQVQENNCIGFQTVTEIKTDANNNIWIASGNIGGAMTRKGTRGVSSWQNGQWLNLSIFDSPLTTDNMLNVAVDAHNRKWFGSWATSALSPPSWKDGINIYNDATDSWQWLNRLGVRNWQPATNTWSGYIPNSPRLFNNTIADIYRDKNGNMLISCSGGGVVVFDTAFVKIGEFQLPGNMSHYSKVISTFHSGNRYFFGTDNDFGLVIWNHHSIPTSTGAHWLSPPIQELNNCSVYGIITYTDVFGEEQNWFATSQGLFMWNGTTWYKYDTDIKRRRFINNVWVNDVLYYVDEERLFGSVRTNPTAIFLDPFGKIWIGSADYGLTRYEPETERYTNYYQANSPLISNFITCFGYDPLNGNLLIGTPDGLNTLFIGISQKTTTRLQTVKAFPNPFRPKYDGYVQIVNLPEESMPVGRNICRIYDAAGMLVVELTENQFARFDWNGRNKKDKKCSSGIYYYVVNDAKGNTRRGKLALIQED